FAVPPVSLIRTVTLARPTTAAVGVNVSVPLAAIAGAAEKSPALSLVTVKLRACAASSGGPALRFVAHATNVCAALFFGTDLFGPLVKLGASLTLVTVTLTVATAVPPWPSPIV